MIIYYIYTSGNLEADVLLKHTIKDIGNNFFYGFKPLFYFMLQQL